MSTTMFILLFTDLLIFSILTIFTGYISIFAFASLKKIAQTPPTHTPPLKIAILIPAYKEDNVIIDTVKSCLTQQYPQEMFETFVISDNMRPETNTEIQSLNASLIDIELTQSSKAGALQYAINQITDFEIVVILDADNIIEPLFLQKINRAFASGTKAVQAHRTAKNMNTCIAILDAISEEINNSIFRKGHNNLGLPAALIGSGMAFEFSTFKRLVNKIKSVSGEDKDLEMLYMSEQIKIDYLENAIVLDEKIQKTDDFRKQRKRWIGAQIEILRRFLPELLPALLKSNYAFCNKIFQALLPPRIIILGIIICALLITLCIEPQLALKWLILLLFLMTSFIVSIPKHLLSRSTLKAIIHLPRIFLIMALNICKINKLANEFIHTPHGVEKELCFRFEEINEQDKNTTKKDS